MVADFAAGSTFTVKALVMGSMPARPFLEELDGDGTGRGLVAIDGDLAILDGYVLSGRNRGGSAIHSRREGVSGTHDGRDHVAGRDFLELFSGSFRGRVDRDREFLRSGLATDRDGGGQRDSLIASPLAGWLTVPSVAMTLLSEDAHVTPFAVGSEMNGSSTVVGTMMPFSTEPVSSPA